MSSSFLAIIAISLEVLPVFSHRLITNPHPDQEWDSVIVSSDPITIRDKSQNFTTPLKHSQVLKPQKRSYEECPENDFACLYGGDDDGTRDTASVVDKFFEQYAQSDDSGDPTEKKDAGDDDINSRNSYWTMVDAQTHNHPFDDKQGWVTLDPVPWSTSKIAKWHPNKVAIHHESRPWDYAPSTQRPVHQFWVSGSHYHSERPTSQWGIGTNDIITDNKPSGFPTGQFHGYGNPNRVSGHLGSGTLPGHYNHFQQSNELKGNYPTDYRQPQNPIHPSPYPSTHPSTYPTHGNGEWVLLSTTKGYSHPQRHRWPIQKNLKNADQRAFASREIKTAEISKYHEEELNPDNASNSGDNRKSDMVVPDEGNNGTSTTPLQILYTSSSSKDGEPTTTFRRKVRLQVLPSLESSSTSHGGLLEVDSNTQTVDEAQQEDEKLQKLKAIANVKKNKIRGYKLVPTSKITGKGINQKNVMTLAAVGAGMIPATMALLVPMALGRRKRSLREGKHTERVLQYRQL